MNSCCHFGALGRCTSRAPVQCAEHLAAQSCISCPPSLHGEGQKAPHALPGVVYSCPMAGTQGHALLSPSLPSPISAHHGTHPNYFAIRSPFLLSYLVEIGQWLQTALWAADRQADRQCDCKSFISVRNQAKNDSLSQGSLSSMSQTEVCKTERIHYTDSDA